MAATQTGYEQKQEVFLSTGSDATPDNTPVDEAPSAALAKEYGIERFKEILDGDRFGYALGLLDSGLLINGTSYFYQKELGRGAHGIVFEFHALSSDSGEDLKYPVVAVKIIKQGCQAKLRHEYEVLQKAYASLYPDVASQVLWHEMTGYSVLVMPFISGQLLKKFVYSDKPNQVKLGVYYRLLMHLNKLHLEVRYVHNDLHPSNVICTVEGEVYLIDFGIAHEVGAISRRRPEDCLCSSHRGSHKILEDEKPVYSELDDYFRFFYYMMRTMLYGGLEYDAALKGLVQAALKIMRVNSNVTKSEINLEGITAYLGTQKETSGVPEEKCDEEVSESTLLERFLPEKPELQPGVEGFYEVYIDIFRALFEEELITGQVDFFWAMLENSLAVLMLFYLETFWKNLKLKMPDGWEGDRFVNAGYRGFLRLILLAKSESLDLGACISLFENCANTPPKTNFLYLCVFLNIALNCGLVREGHGVNERAILCNVSSFEAQEVGFDIKVNDSVEAVLKNVILKVLVDDKHFGNEDVTSLKNDCLIERFKSGVPEVARAFLSERFPELEFKAEDDSPVLATTP